MIVAAFCLFIFAGCSGDFEFKVEDEEFAALPEEIQADSLERMNDFGPKGDYQFDAVQYSDINKTIFVNFGNRSGNEWIALMYNSDTNEFNAAAWRMNTTEMKDTIQGTHWLDLFRIRDPEQTVSDDEARSAVEELCQTSVQMQDAAEKDVGNYRFFVSSSQTFQYIAFYNA